MKPKTRPPRNNLPVRRINVVLLCLIAFLLCNLVIGWLIWQQRISGNLAWTVQLLSGGALVALIVALFAANRRVLVEPVRSIAAWASQIRQGDFSARLDAGHAELYGLTDDINRLAEWLESLAESKNQELLEQGARLKIQTHIVRLLYDIPGDFSRNATAGELIERAIQPMAEVLEARRIEFHRFNEDGKPARVAAWGGADGRSECVKIPLRFSTKRYGECRVWFDSGRFPLPDEFSQLLYTLGRNIGMALERIDLHAESERAAKMRERTHLANELHDSLAQTIAGLRFQVRVLDDLLHQQEEHAVWVQLENVENMLEEANAELRSLIGYFRGPIDPAGLRPAIKAVVARFRSESASPLFFQDQWGEVDIPEKWQLEIVRIIQEALTNIRKHSQAKNARLLLRPDEDDKYTALIEDDGIGMAAVTDSGSDSGPDSGLDTNNSGEHIGLSVMAQRAKSIGASFQIESEPGEGTRILLSFSTAAGR